MSSMYCQKVGCEAFALPKQKYCCPDHAPFYNLLDTPLMRDISARAVLQNIDKKCIRRPHDPAPTKPKNPLREFQNYRNRLEQSKKTCEKIHRGKCLCLD